MATIEVINFTDIQMNNMTEPFYLYTASTNISRLRLRYNDPRFIISISLSLLISLLAIFSNLFNLIIIYRSPILHDTNNLLLFHLSIIDFLNGLIVVPVSVLTSIIDYSGLQLCKLQGFVLFVLYDASLAATSAISIDRCTTVVNPYGYDSNISKRKCMLTSIYIWSLPFIIATLPLLGLERYGLGKYNLLLFCGISFEFYDDNYLVYWIMMTFIAAAIVIILCSYSIIFKVAFQKSLQNQAHNNKLKKSIRTTALIVGSSLICWLPYTIYGVQSYIFRRSVVNYTPSTFKVIAVMLILINAAINPLIYGITNSTIRMQFYKLFRFSRIGQTP
ncbi:Adenosine receptor A2b [Trichoplax sp. H2]|nr:Adenosine receptor A2b [Trichoplax sp. H2]|eukprot:RDD36639.1 Adenosine receptor A2b [Trichoplax sp. H2]